MSEVSEFLRMAIGDEAFLHSGAVRQIEKTKTTTMLFIGTPNGCKAIKADPKAAERAKRYIWSRIEHNQPNDWRAE